MAKNPMQPITRRKDGTIAFKPNKIVEHLLDHGGIDLNHLSGLTFPQDDWVQFAQLIGYSVSGFHELSYVPDTAAAAASQAARETLSLASHSVGCRDNGCNIHSGVEEE